MEKLVDTVEFKIKNKLPEKFSTMYDRWSDSGTYFVATYAVYPSNAVSRYGCHPLCFSPSENENDHSAKEHEQLLRFVLGSFEKNFSNVVAIIADSYITIRLLSRNVGLLFLGCASHRFNNSVKDIIRENAIDNIKCILSELCFSVGRAKFHKYTDYAPVKCNETRWSSVSNMLNRYAPIREHLPKLRIEDEDNIILGRKKEQEINSLLDVMEKLK